MLKEVNQKAKADNKDQLEDSLQKIEETLKEETTKIVCKILKNTLLK